MHQDSGSTGSWDYLDFELEVSEGGPENTPCPSVRQRVRLRKRCASPSTSGS